MSVTNGLNGGLTVAGEGGRGEDDIVAGDLVGVRIRN